MNANSFAGTLPQWLTALASIGSVVIAVVALRVASASSAAWKNTLISQRGDNLLAAVYDLEAAVRRLLAAYANDADGGQAKSQFDELKGYIVMFRKAVSIARRSYANSVDVRWPELIEYTIADMDSLGPPIAGLGSDELIEARKLTESRLGKLLATTVTVRDEVSNIIRLADLSFRL